MSRFSIIFLVIVAVIVVGLLALGFSKHERPMVPVEKAMLNEAAPK